MARQFLDISFITVILLREEPCCKFMLKHNIKNYFGQFTKTLFPVNV